MNIAIVSTEFITETNFDGGLANYTYKLAKWLHANNHRVIIFLTSKKTETFIFEGIKIIRVEIPDLRWRYKYNLERFRLGFLLNNKKYFRLEFQAYSKFINQQIKLEDLTEKFDIIHYPNNGGMVNDCPPSIPNVVRLSGLTVGSHKVGGYGNSDLSVNVQEKYEIKGMKKANSVFSPSKMTAAITEKLINKNIEIIETPFIQPTDVLDDSLWRKYLLNKKYILFFGSIGLIKGVGTIAEMIFELLEAQPDLHFVFVGKKLNNEIKGIPVWDYLIEKSKHLKDRIIHIEPLKHPQLFPIIQGSQCVVLPSRIDNFPNTCIEAMANSKIVIGTIGNGFDQLIENEKSGFVIPVDDSKALLETIIKVLHLPSDQKQKIELNAKNRIDLLNPDIVLNQVLDLYKQTIKSFKA